MCKVVEEVLSSLFSPAADASSCEAPLQLSVQSSALGWWDVHHHHSDH
jgi:hypothetical protein